MPITNSMPTNAVRGMKSMPGVKPSKEMSKPLGKEMKAKLVNTFNKK